LRENHLAYCSCVVYHLARHKRKISLAPINSLPGKNCLVAAIRRCTPQAFRARNDKTEKRERKRKLAVAAHVNIWRQDDRKPRSLRIVWCEKLSRLSRFLLCPVIVAAVGLLVPRRRQRRLSQSS
jgi:hypothetical protein